MNLLATAGPDPSQVLPWVALVIYVVGLAGIVIPVLPGLMLCVVAVLVWAIGENDVAAWLTLAVVAALWAVGMVLQVTIPGRRMKRQGVGGSTLLVGALAGIVGFFVIPVVGLPVGFVLGVLGVEYTRTRDLGRAWYATKRALVGVLHSMGIELGTAVVIGGVWATSALAF